MGIKTVVQDVYTTLKTKHSEVPSEPLSAFADNCKEIIEEALCKTKPHDTQTLRMSNIGRPARQMWYDFNSGEAPNEGHSGATLLKFLYGSIIEELVLCLVKLSGHKVADTQRTATIDGIKGHMDCTIDEVPVDVKSASSFQFKKFKTGKIYQDDPFGYIHQLSAYANYLNAEEAGFLVFDKSTGEIHLMMMDDLDILDSEERIKYMKEAVNLDKPPVTKCYEPVPDGKQGNMKLGTQCGYCPHKFKCWEGLREFTYSNGPTYLTKVVKTPRVTEVKSKSD